MTEMRGRWGEVAFAILRIVAGLLFAYHGAQKFGLLGGPAMTGKPLMLVAAIIELVGGLLITIGLLTRPAAFIASGEMATAYFMAHAPSSPWPAVNHGEPAVLFCFLFLYMAARGAGIWSVDAMRGGAQPIRG
ncbi:MAG: DoxX family protein [Acidobacteriota bacterium]